jgi:hypothetical protein
VSNETYPQQTVNIPELRQLPNDEEGEVAAFILFGNGHSLFNQSTVTIPKQEFKS